jgi:glycosyltransferase involved in cell wall biosynthesis
MGKNAFYAESDGYEDVLAALNAWADADAAELFERTANARDRAVAMFSAEAMTSRYQSLYAEVAPLSSTR